MAVPMLRYVDCSVASKLVTVQMQQLKQWSLTNMLDVLQSLMAGDITYERHTTGPRSMLDLGQLQDHFQLLLSQAHPDHIAAFFYWLDLKVAQFKVFGSCLSHGEICGAL